MVYVCPASSSFLPLSSCLLQLGLRSFVSAWRRPDVRTHAHHILMFHHAARRTTCACRPFFREAQQHFESGTALRTNVGVQPHLTGGQVVVCIISLAALLSHEPYYKD